MAFSVSIFLVLPPVGSHFLVLSLLHASLFFFFKAYLTRMMVYILVSFVMIFVCLFVALALTLLFNARPLDQFRSLDCRSQMGA